MTTKRLEQELPDFGAVICDGCRQAGPSPVSDEEEPQRAAARAGWLVTRRRALCPACKETK